MAIPKIFGGREIFQIAAIPANEQNNLGVFALADDGTLWENYVSEANAVQRSGDWGEWRRLPDLPQGGAQ